MKTSMMVAASLFAAGAFANNAAAQNQSMPGMNMPRKPDVQTTAPASPMQGRQVQANGSIAHDLMNLQEPENPTHQTGTNTPVPELLKEVVHRPKMALQEFIALADGSNPTLAQANAYVRRSAAQAQQIGLYPNPTVGYQGEQIRGGSYGGGEQGAYLQQTVVTAGKLGLRRNIYNQQKQSDQIGVEEQTYRVHNDVTQAFYTALTSQATVIVRGRLLRLSLDAVETVHQLANVGQADSPDILQAEVESEQAKIEYLTAQGEFLQNFRVLAALAGKQDLAISPLAGVLESPPELDVEQQVAIIVANSPTIKRTQQEVAIREARLKDAKRESIPDLQLKAGEQYNFEHLPGESVRATGPQSFASMGVSIPLWNRNQGNVNAAQAEVERAKKNLAREQLSLKQLAEPVAQTYRSSRFTADRYRTELLPRAQRAYQLYLTKYQSMAMAYPQVLVSQRTLFQLQIGYLNALHSVWTNAVALQNYTLSGGLIAPLSTGSDSITLNLPSSSPGSPE